MPVDRRSSKYVRRPAFSIPLMTNNFRKFNARSAILGRIVSLSRGHTTDHDQNWNRLCLPEQTYSSIQLENAITYSIIHLGIHICLLESLPTGSRPPRRPLALRDGSCIRSTTPSATTCSFDLFDYPLLLLPWTGTCSCSHHQASRRNIQGLLPQYARPSEQHGRLLHAS